MNRRLRDFHSSALIVLSLSCAVGVTICDLKLEESLKSHRLYNAIFSTMSADRNFYYLSIFACAKAFRQKRAVVRQIADNGRRTCHGFTRNIACRRAHLKCVHNTQGFLGVS